ncbi:MAG: TrkH family potassium uptake protein [Clostridia bacterium]|nr:TrkH family potassium uptake protein [Clostridia bacterium]
MNYSVMRYILGWVLTIESLFLLISAGVGFAYGDGTVGAFLLAAGICLVLGLPQVLIKPKTNVFYGKEGFCTVALSWIVLSLFGALPFVFSGEIPNYIDALFETVSGFTTTGASILTDIEALSHAALFWRSFTHWIGGMGVLVFILAILPMTGGSKMQLMKAESPGPAVSKLVPQTRHTAIILYGLYFLLTVAEIIFLRFGHLSLFESATMTFGTAGTGGFGIRNTSAAEYTPYVQWVLGIFMVLFGVNFNVYFLLIVRKWKQGLKSEELRTYLSIIAAATLLITLNIRQSGLSFADTVRTAFFQVSSIMTTTGFSTCDFDAWPAFSRVILVCLMCIGACAGSTGGGIKVSRIIILFKRAREEIQHYINPRTVTRIRLEGKTVDREVIHSTSAFLITYILIFAASVLLIALEGHDTTTCFTAVAATINNIGPGLSLVGPTSNYGFFTPFSKIVLLFDMLVGRLELFPLLLLFAPKVWKSGR